MRCRSPATAQSLVVATAILDRLLPLSPFILIRSDSHVLHWKSARG
jgi:hypothetical protein